MSHRKKRKGKKHSQPNSKSKQPIGCQNPTLGLIDEQSKVLSSVTEQIGLFTIPEEDASAKIIGNITETTSLLSDDDDDSSDSSWIFTDNASSSNSDISYSDSICSISSRRSYSDVLADRPPSAPGTSTSCEQTQTQDVLEVVDIKGKSPLHEPDSWEIVVKKESRREKLDYPSKQHYLPGK